MKEKSQPHAMLSKRIPRGPAASPRPLVRRHETGLQRGVRARRWAPAAILASLMVACVPLNDLDGYSVPPAGSGGGDAGVAAGTGGMPSSSDPDATSPSGGSRMDSGGDGQPDAALPRPNDAGPQLDAAGACSGDGGFVLEGSCYLVVAQALSWTEGRDACVDWGGTLATLETVQEDDALLATLEDDVWIGLNDIETEDEFVWVSGSDSPNRRWGEAQPNNFMEEQDCVRREAATGTWSDDACDDPGASLCERPL